MICQGEIWCQVNSERPGRVSVWNFDVYLAFLASEIKSANQTTNSSQHHQVHHMPTNRSFFSQFIGSLIGFRPRSPSSGSPIKTSAFTTSGFRRRSTSSLNSAGSGGDAAGIRDHETPPLGAKWWIGGRRADGSERYYPLVPLRYPDSPYVSDLRRYRSTDRLSL